jgi:hypothetical protein
MMLFNAWTYCARILLHGTSEQRKYWFMKGYKTGDIKQGNTFDEIKIKTLELLKNRDSP